MSRLLYYNCSGNLTRTGRNVARIQIFTQDTSRAHVSDVGRLPSKGVTLTPPPFLRDRTTPHSDNRTPVSTNNIVSNPAQNVPVRLISD